MPYSTLEACKEKARYLNLKGHDIAYWQSGDGPDLLFIHGFPSAAYDWHAQREEFESCYRVTCLDLLGFGFSDKPFPHQYTLSEQADIVDALMLALDVKTCQVVAHDYGDSVAQELLTRQSEGRIGFSILSVCYLNGGLFSESHRPVFMQKLLKSRWGGGLYRLLTKTTLRKNFIRIFGPETPPSETDIDNLWQLLNLNQGRRVTPAILKYIDERAVQRDRWVNAMQKSDIPQLFVNGIHDPISGKHMLERYQTLLPHCESRALEVGHYPQLEAPTPVNTILYEWLSKYPSR